MKAIFTSSLGGQMKIAGKRLPAKFPDDNGLLQNLQVFWEKNSKVMVISGSPEDYDKNDSVVSCLNGAFSLSNLDVSEVLMCDEKNKEVIKRLPEMDVLILTGGHVPTQNRFLKRIGLKVRLHTWDGLLIAWSAGSMNCAGTVYAGPELAGEAIDPNYQRWIRGLGITNTNIFPHFDALRDEMLDGMRLIEDITYSDSMGHEIIALNNGSYIVSDNGVETLYGETYRIRNGELKQICTNGKEIRLQKTVNDNQTAYPAEQSCRERRFMEQKLSLVRPSISHKEAALRFRQSFFDAGETTIDGSELLDKKDSYEEWLAFVTENAQKASAPTDTYFAFDSENKLVGIIDFRHELGTFFKDFGHSGYSVAPEERQKGYATQMLALIVEKAREAGLSTLQLSALRSNVPSVRTIEKNGGKLVRSFDFYGNTADVFEIIL